MAEDAPELCLTGFRDSVYTWAVRIALAEIGVPYAYAEANPFEAEGRTVLAGLTPFGRVPVLRHGAVCVYETAAILDYLDAAFGDGWMTPEEPLARARMRQVIGIVDAYGYWPLVRQVYSHVVYGPLTGDEGDVAEVAAGRKAATPVLAALEEIAAEGHVLGTGPLTLADCLLLPMLDSFAQAEVGREMLAEKPALQAWLERMRARPSVLATRVVPGGLEDGEQA